MKIKVFCTKDEFLLTVSQKWMLFSISGLQGLISGPGLDFQPPELGSLCGAAQMMPDAARCPQMLPDGAGGSQMPPDAASSYAVR